MKMVNKPGELMRSYSVWGMVAGLLMGLQEIVPLWEGVVSDGTFAVLGATATSLGLVGRFIKQGIEDAQND